MTRESQLAGRTLLVVGGSSGIGLETARRARGEGAKVILTARDPERVHRVGLELQASIGAFDATDFHRLGRFFDELPNPIDDILVTGSRPHYEPLVELNLDDARRDLDAHLLLPLQVACGAARKLRPSGTLLFLGCTGGPPAGAGAFISGLTAALSVMTKSLACELAPIRVNLIAAGFVGPGDVAALAVHLMANTAITGATFEIDSGRRLVSRQALGSLTGANDPSEGL